MELRVVDLFGRTAIASRGMSEMVYHNRLLSKVQLSACGCADFAFAERVVAEEPLLRTVDTVRTNRVRAVSICYQLRCWSFKGICFLRLFELQDLDESIRKLAEDLAYEHHGFLQVCLCFLRSY